MTEIFVFGSNLVGRYGKGAAKVAIYGQGEGLQGNSYGIPTKDERLRVRRLVEIADSITRFIEFARENPEYKFKVTRVGCGLAGYNWANEIRPLFGNDLPDNIEFITKNSENYT